MKIIKNQFTWLAVVMPSRIKVFWNSANQDRMLSSVHDIILAVSNGDGVFGRISGWRAKNRYHQVFPGLLSMNSGTVISLAFKNCSTMSKTSSFVLPKPTAPSSMSFWQRRFSISSPRTQLFPLDNTRGSIFPIKKTFVLQALFSSPINWNHTCLIWIHFV